LVTMLSGLTAGLARENISAVEGLRADHLVFDQDAAKASFADSRITDQVWQAWKITPGVTAERLGVSMSRLTPGSGAALFGVEPEGTLAGGMPVGPGRIVLSEALAADTGLKPGDTTKIAGHNFTIAGTAGAASYSHAPVAWLSIA